MTEPATVSMPIFWIVSLGFTVLGILGTINAYLFNDVRGRLVRLEGKLDHKVDKEDCDKNRERCGEFLRRDGDQERQVNEALWAAIKGHSHTGLDPDSKVTVSR